MLARHIIWQNVHNKTIPCPLHFCVTHMLICAPTQDVVNRRNGNPKPLRKTINATSILGQFNHVQNAFRVRKDRAISTKLFCHVLHVIRLRAQYQVRGIHAPRMIAPMQDHPPLGDLPMVDLPGHPVRQNLPPTCRIVDHPIPHAVRIPRPSPTPLAPLHVLPEPLLHGHRVWPRVRPIANPRRQDLLHMLWIQRHTRMPVPIPLVRPCFLVHPQPLELSQDAPPRGPKVIGQRLR